MAEWDTDFDEQDDDFQGWGTSTSDPVAQAEAEWDAIMEESPPDGLSDGDYIAWWDKWNARMDAAGSRISGAQGVKKAQAEARDNLDRSPAGMELAKLKADLVALDKDLDLLTAAKSTDSERLQDQHESLAEKMLRRAPIADRVDELEARLPYAAYTDSQLERLSEDYAIEAEKIKQARGGFDPKTSPLQLAKAEREWEHAVVKASGFAAESELRGRDRELAALVNESIEHKAQAAFDAETREIQREIQQLTQALPRMKDEGAREAGFRISTLTQRFQDPKRRAQHLKAAREAHDAGVVEFATQHHRETLGR